jgi:hypothetical protein
MRNIFFGLLALTASACGPHVGAQGSDVGAACTSNAMCSSECLQGNDAFPGGMCTIACTSDVQCPKGSTCVDGGHNSGICAVACVAPTDCSAFGRGFTCDSADQFGGAGGKVLICRVP